MDDERRAIVAAAFVVFVGERDGRGRDEERAFRGDVERHVVRAFDRQRDDALIEPVEVDANGRGLLVFLLRCAAVTGFARVTLFVALGRGG